MLTAVVLTDSGLPFQGARRESGSQRGVCFLARAGLSDHCRAAQAIRSFYPGHSDDVPILSLMLSNQPFFPEVFKKKISKFSLNELTN